MGRFAVRQAAGAFALAITGFSSPAVFADPGAVAQAPAPAAAPAPAPAAEPAVAPAPAEQPAAAPVADPAAVKKQARELLDKNQPQAAYELLAPLEDELGDDPDYDYLLGTAALSSGDPGHAAFAFERCLALDPRDGTCRVQMARAHLAMGENASAQREFDTIQKSSPPPDVQAKVSKYLGSLAAFEKSQKSQLTGYVEAGVGADSNINRANTQSQIALPGLQPLFGNTPFTLSGTSLQQHANFAQTLAGFSGVYNANDRWALVADGDFTDQAYQDRGAFDNRFGDLDAGAVYKHGASQYSLRAQGQLYDVGNYLYRRLWGAIGQYSYAFSTVSQVAVYLQSDMLTYPEFGQDIHDTNRRTLGTAYSTVLDAPYSPAVFAGAYLGQEVVTNSDWNLFSQHFLGLRGGATLTVNRKVSINGLLSGELRHYPLSTLVIDPGYGDNRQDQEIDASVGMVYTFSPDFSLRPNYLYTHVNSNTQLNRYSRSVFSLDLRYDM